MNHHRFPSMHFFNLCINHIPSIATDLKWSQSQYPQKPVGLATWMSVFPRITFTATLYRYGEALPWCSLCPLDHWKQHSRDTSLLGCAFDLWASISCAQGWWETWYLRFDHWFSLVCEQNDTCPIGVDGCFFAMLCVCPVNQSFHPSSQLHCI